MSKTIQISIISVGPETHVPVAGKAGYNKLEVAYKDSGKVSGKNLVDWVDKGMYATVKALQQGDKVEVVLEKEQGSDGREYWQWKQVTKLSEGQGEVATEGTPAPSPTVSGSAPTQNRTGKVVGSNYETPEERALRRAADERRQVLIVRQSSIGHALDYLKSQSEGGFSLQEVLDYADTIYSYVYEVSNDKLSKAKSAQTDAAVAKGTRGRPKATKEPLGTNDLDDDIPF